MSQSQADLYPVSTPRPITTDGSLRISISAGPHGVSRLARLRFCVENRLARIVELLSQLLDPVPDPGCFLELER